MHILIINPNTTAAMTATIAAAARTVAGSGTRITAMNPDEGPASIQGPEDGTAALPGLFKLFNTEVLQNGSYDAVVIACFDDTGLAELKACSPVPVIGIGEAGFHAAMLVSQRFSIVTTLAVSIPVIEQNLSDYGFTGRCAVVRASGVPVLDLGSGAQDIAREIELALEEDKPGAIVLGCAGMADLAAAMTEQFGLPVIDGVAAAVVLAEALGRAGIGNSPAPAEASP
ncbi:Hydantoin racemase [hydrothermal vent metagenome]|uniref:Hydantoin racemase n=1 Tax=hydrothermal vent metagenome TaxID=652676 RepID=A0A3B0TLL4_9ZZZZ